MIEYVAETGSTNADLIGRVLGQGHGGERVSEGDWLVADRQVSGRGRQGRQWFDGAGNFMGSTIVRRQMSDPPVSSLALTTGLAVFEVCQSLCPASAKPVLKWPNDLLLRNAKLSGILLEGAGDAVIVGIGVNLAQAPTLPDRATIAFTDFGPAPDRDHFAELLAAQFATELNRWRTFGLEGILRRWVLAAHPMGTLLSVHDANGQSQSGEFAGLAEDGSLLLRLADGSTRAIHAGEISLD